MCGKWQEEGWTLNLAFLKKEDTPMRLVKAERQSVSDRVPNPWSIFKSPEELGGDRSTHGRRRLNERLEGILEV